MLNTQNIREKIGFLGITGATNNGKSTIREFLHKLIVPPSSKSSILHADASDIVRWGLNLPNHLGELVRAEKPHMDAGEYLKDSVMIPLFVAWLEHVLSENPRLRFLMISGFPRTEKQVELIAQLFARYSVVHILADEQTLKNAFLERLKKSQELGSVRPDDRGGLPVFHNRIRNYKMHTVPALDKLQGRVLPINRADPIATRLHTVLNHLIEYGKSPLGKHRLARKAIGKLKDRSHPIHGEIAALEARKN